MRTCKTWASVKICKLHERFISKKSNTELLHKSQWPEQWKKIEMERFKKWFFLLSLEEKYQRDCCLNENLAELCFLSTSCCDMCSHTCTQTHTCIHAHTLMYTYTHICTYILIHTHTCTHSCTHTHVHIYTCTHTHAYIYTYARAHIHNHTHRHTNTHKVWQLLHFQFSMRDRGRQKARSESLVLQLPWAKSSFAATTPSEKPPPPRRPVASLGSRLSSSPCFSGPCHSTAHRRCSKAHLDSTCAPSASTWQHFRLQADLRQSPDCSPAHLSSDTVLPIASRYTSHFCSHFSETSAPLILLGT
jgi:hypothetical protein